MSMRVLVSHREPLLAAGVASVLGSEPDMQLIDDGPDTGSGSEGPDVVVTDYETGLVLAREWGLGARGQPAAQKIVVVTQREREHDVREAMEAGVSGYVIQACGGGEVARAVRAVSRGECHVCATVADRLAQSFAREALTAREQAVLRLLGAGRCNKTIAREMRISLATVKSYVRAILGKLGASSRTEAVRIAAARGLVEVEMR